MKTDEEEIFFWEKGENWFFIPQNIYIIGTMNTIDRSVDSFDLLLEEDLCGKKQNQHDVIKSELNKILPDSNNLGIELSKAS